MTVAGNSTAEDEVSAPSTKVGCTETRNDNAISIAQMGAPVPANINAQLAPLDGTNGVIDTDHCTAEVEPRQRMEITEPQDLITTCNEGESSTFTIKSRGHSAVRRQGKAEASYEGVDIAMADKDDTPPHKDRDQTPEELRCQKRNKNLKIDKLGEQQRESSRSLRRKRSHKSVKA
jgi:hypothetical protein